MSDLWKLTDAGREAYLTDVRVKTLVDAILIPVTEPLFTREEAANDPEVRRLILDDYEYDRSWEPTND